MQEHELVRPQGQDGKRPAIVIGKLDFARAIAIRHNDRANLTTPQRQRLTILEMCCRNIFEQGNHSVHV